MVPFYAAVESTPKYLAGTTEDVSTDNFYWSSRMIGALADAHYGKCLSHIERYQLAVQSQGHELIGCFDKEMCGAKSSERKEICKKANNKIAEMLQRETQQVLNKVLYETSCQMKNSYARSDA